MVYSVRQRCGRQLAKEAPVDVDLVSTVPDSATPAALAYAAQVTRLNKQKHEENTHMYLLKFYFVFQDFMYLFLNKIS